MKFFQQIFILGVSTLVVGLSVNALSSKPLSLIASPEQFHEKVAEGMEAHKSEILDLWKAGDAIFVDARSLDEYAKGRILGAIAIPYKDFEEGIPENVDLLPRDQLLVIYCDGTDCHASQVVSDKLIEMGFDKENLKIFSGGWKEWLEIGGEVEHDAPSE
jgi:rhodanese-related sulfurtransferase